MLGPYVVGFVLVKSGDDGPDALLGGSGTLVSIDGTEGILTAKHVFNSLERNKTVGLILTSSGSALAHHISFNIEYCAYVMLPAEGEPSPSGPDLGFLIPPPDIVSTLRARQSFYNLTKRKDEVLAKQLPLDHGLWVLAGLSRWTSEGFPERGFQKVKVFRGAFGEGKVTREYDDGKFDYLIFEALYNELYEGPERFRGFSGGGLWQLLGKEEDGKLLITQRLLSGVAFYESDLLKDGDRVTREITCHGRNSLYGVLISTVGSQQQS